MLYQLTTIPARPNAFSVPLQIDLCAHAAVVHVVKPRLAVMNQFCGLPRPSSYADAVQTQSCVCDMNTQCAALRCRPEM